MTQPVAVPPTEAPGPSDKDIAACKQLMDDGVVVARAVPPIVAAGECGVAAPVLLESIVLADKRQIRLEPAPTIRCDLAAAIARWVREDVVPMLASKALTLERITNADAYSCRPRNRVAGAKISEHARGNAIDLDAFVLSPTRRVPLTSAEAAPFASEVRASACARFTTVLGPGSDSYHETHIHLDLEDRRTHGTLCQWRIP